MAPSKLVNAIKANSSAWMKQCGVADFAWQRGGGYFSVGHRHVETVRRYIQRQPEHHARRETMREEYVRLLREHGVDYDEAYLLHAPT